MPKSQAVNFYHCHCFFTMNVLEQQVGEMFALQEQKYKRAGVLWAAIGDAEWFGELGAAAVLYVWLAAVDDEISAATDSLRDALDALSRQNLLSRAA